MESPDLIKLIDLLSSVTKVELMTSASATTFCRAFAAADSVFYLQY